MMGAQTHLSGIDDETDHDDGGVLRRRTAAFFHPRHTCRPGRRADSSLTFDSPAQRRRLARPLERHWPYQQQVRVQLHGDADR